MKRNRLSDSDLQVSEICLGTMTWGEQNTEAEAHAQLDRALAHGINFAAGLLEKACRAAIPDARPAFIEFVQTFGDLVNFHPHVHVLAADGVFRADGAFVRLPPIPEALLEGGSRRAVLAFLVEKRAVSEELRARMLGWRYSGVSVHNQVRVAADDTEGRKKLAGYMLRAPLSLAKMTYDAPSGTVIYRSKMHLGLNRNFQVMAGAEWLELLCKHIPDRTR